MYLHFVFQNIRVFKCLAFDTTNSAFIVTALSIRYIASGMPDYYYTVPPTSS